MRLRLVFVSILLVWTILLAKIYQYAVKSNSYFENIALENSVKTTQIIPVRGQILDRLSNPLAINRLGFSLSIAPHLKDNELNATIAEISRYFDVNSSAIYKEYKKSSSFYNHKFINVVNFLDYNATSRAFSHLNLNDKIQINPDLKRFYPYNSIASHVIGYVGRVTQKDIENDPSLSAIKNIGKSGIERYYNEILQGDFGEIKSKVTVLNKVIETLDYKEPKTHQIMLSIDIRLQELLKELFKDKAGSAVIMDVQTGEILAAGSYPEYDLNLFVTGIDDETWRKIIEDLNHPFTNKIASGLYPPGSVLKMGVGMSFLNSGLIKPEKTYTCRGYIELGGRKFRCWKAVGHGAVNLTSALRESCDVYFYEGSLEVGIDAISHDLIRYGFGQKTGIDLPNEYIGTIPNKAWKMAKYKKPWFLGETVNASIGQGDVLVTPIQVAKYTAQIASGKGLTPHFIKGIDGVSLDKVDENSSEILRNLRDKFAPYELFTPLEKNSLSFVRAGMYEVANHPQGTTYKLLNDMPIKIAAKTGTAQVVFIPQNEIVRMKERDMEYYRRSQAWMTSFGPYDEPRYAVSVLVEHGGSGGSAAGPLIKKIYAKLAELGYLQISAPMPNLNKKDKKIKNLQ